MPDIFLVPGVRTPFVKGGGPFAQYDALAISAPVAPRRVWSATRVTSDIWTRLPSSMRL